MSVVTRRLNPWARGPRRIGISMRVPRSPELEADILDDPDDPERIAVWADALLTAGHPLGEWLQIAVRDPDTLDPALRRAAERLLSADGQWWYGPLERAAVWASGAVQQRRKGMPVEKLIVLPPRVVAPLGTASTHLGLFDEARGTVSFARHLGERPTAFALRRLRITGPSLPTEPLKGLPDRALESVWIEKPARADGARFGDLPPRLRHLSLDGVPLAGGLRGGLRTLEITASEALDLDALAESELPDLEIVRLRGPVDVRGLVQAELPALRQLEVTGASAADADLLRDQLGGRLGAGLVVG